MRSSRHSAWSAVLGASVIVAAFGAAVGASHAAGDEALLVDLREPAFLKPPELPAAEKSAVLAAVSSNDAETTINASARGAFTAAGRDETVYLIQSGGPRAADPAAPAGVTLAIFAGGKLEKRIATDAGNFIQATPDIDGDGVRELLLRSDNFQMGVATTRLTLVGLRDGSLDVVASFDEALVNRCGDARFGGDVDASAIRYRAVAHARPEFRIERYTARCEDGEPPAAAKFTPAAH